MAVSQMFGNDLAGQSIVEVEPGEVSHTLALHLILSRVGLIAMQVPTLWRGISASLLPSLYSSLLSEYLGNSSKHCIERTLSDQDKPADLQPRNITIKNL